MTYTVQEVEAHIVEILRRVRGGREDHSLGRGERGG